MKRKQSHDNTHLTLDERRIVQAGIENGTTKATIARTIGKDATTVAKEIRAHRIFKPRNTFNRPILCAKMKTCPTKPCVMKCEQFEDPKCTRRDKSPGACNKCDDYAKCKLDRFLYNAETADKEYRVKLVESREGINLTSDEREMIGAIIAPLLKQGQSIHQLLSAHPEIEVSERSMYTYIETGVFKNFGVDNFSLKEQVNRRQRERKCKKRKEPANYTGRKYDDYLRFCVENPHIPTVEMDTLYNSQQGPFLQTFHFVKPDFMVGFLHPRKDNECMAKGVDQLQDMLGAELFSEMVSLLLTDRGTEFEKFNLFELDAAGNSRLNIFFCDPMQSSQKPNVECNHNYVRDIIPNGYPMNVLTQEDIYQMFSHINSTPRKVLGDKSPYEVLSFLYNEKVPECLNIKYIPRDEVILKPYLIFNKKEPGTHTP